jgi:hypothetical protein
MKKKSIYWLAGILAVVLLGYWLYKAVTKPLPGELVSDLGRDHVTDVFGVKYGSNPPSSGPHFPIWAKPGVYDRLISDGYLIHSMEHGYVIIWYDCGQQLTNNNFQFRIPDVYAHDEPTKESTDSGQFLMHMDFVPKSGESWTTPDNQPEVEVPLPDSFNTDSCKNLVNQLSGFTKVAQRVIVTPRVGMDSPIALTAWRRILKLNTVDQEVITNFIKTFHNKGPEATME